MPGRFLFPPSVVQNGSNDSFFPVGLGGPPSSSVGILSGNVNGNSIDGHLAAVPLNKSVLPGRKSIKYKPSSGFLKCHHEGCPYRVTRPQFMASHLKYHEYQQLGVKRVYTCDEEGCGYLATEYTNISGHRRVHAKSKPFICGIDGCEHVSSHGNNMRSHQKRVHGLLKNTSLNRADDDVADI